MLLFEMKKKLQFDKLTLFSLIVATITLTLYILKITSLNSGIDTLYDEGYLLLKLWEANNNVGSHGGSQWPIIVSRLFGNKLSSSLISLRFLDIVLQLSSVIYLIIATYKTFIKYSKHTISEIIIYISLIVLLLYPTYGSLFFYYNSMQQVLFCIIIGNTLFYTSVREKYNFIILFISGFISLFSILIILPSGLIITLLLVIYILFKNDFNLKSSFLHYIYFLTGIFIAILIYHFHINNLFVVYTEMQDVAASITKTNRGYDPITFILKYFVYFKDMLLSFIPLITASVLTFMLYKKNRFAAYLLFTISIVAIYFWWPWNKAIYSTMIALPVFSSLIIFLINTDRKKPILILLFFLLIFPFIGLLGTNVYYGSKIIWFIIPWAIIPIIVLSCEIKRKWVEEYKKLFIISTTLLYLVIPFNIVFSKNDNKYYFKAYNNISDIKINKDQLIYFNRVDSILSEYNYIQDKHHILATQLDHMTIYVFNAKPNSTYFQPMDFLVDKNSANLKRPDFIFLTKFDLDIVGEKIKKNNWDFPDAYDKHYIGTPETFQTGYSTERWLYCLKSLK